MPRMTTAQIREFLTGGLRTAKLACVRADGAPHVTPVWFLLDGDDVVFTTSRDSIKGAAILRDPRVCLCVDDDRPPFSYVVLRGTATVGTDLDELRDWAGRLGAPQVLSIGLWGRSSARSWPPATASPVSC